ncbi:LacI family DNA-binding transcriptional regulator [Sphingomonas sp. Tas61C01]|uniref:LacI family DNA-binding transcriptional regulator n=1 Tax=Sphingomonas sp. Tas61C01 TaxID=3458297 RepID=UPI00403EB0A2
MARRSTKMTEERPTSGVGTTVTSYDVARHAGVSQSAVSRCFTPGASVSPRTRDRIMKAVDALGYRPNMIARSLITKRSNLIAVIVANLGFNPEFTGTLSRLFAARGLNLLFYTLDREDDADRVIEQLWQYRVDGVVSAARLSERHIEQMTKRGVPVVFLNRVYDTIPVNSVCCDQAEGERWLVDRLWAAGHRRFGIVAGPDASIVSRQRVTGASDRLATLGGDPPRLAIGDFTYDGGRAALRALAVGGSGMPEAVICANDMMALGCIDEARHGFGRRIPQDLSIVGFDGSAPGRWASYDLTTVRQPTHVMIEAAIDMLVTRIEDPSTLTEKRVFSGELVIGGSATIA